MLHAVSCMTYLISLSSFMWQYNYGGIQAKDHDEFSASVSASSSTRLPGDLQGEIVSSWNIAEHLPKSTQVSYSSY